MEQKVFKLPKHPVRGEQKIVVERPSSESVWYLVIDKDKSIPLVNLKGTLTAKKVIEEAKNQQGEGWLMWYMGNGYSRLDKVVR